MLFRALVIAIFLACCGVGHSAELAVGLSAFEAGDDRQRPAIMGHYGFDEEYFARGYLYGRAQGPVTERGYLVAAKRHLDVFRMLDMRFLKGSLGIVGLVETTEIKFSDSPSDNDEEISYNLGGAFGLHARAPLKSPVILEFSWESNLFLAGEAGILLAMAHSQYLSFVAGIEF